ncbi:MAG: ATP synthase F0 subunit C [Thermodesulfobacteriota bacterium]
MQFFSYCMLVAGFAVAIAAAGCALPMGLSIKSAVEGIARNPESSGRVTVTLLIGLALIEALCIYTLVVSLIIIYAAPVVQTVTNLL